MALACISSAFRLTQLCIAVNVRQQQQNETIETFCSHLRSDTYNSCREGFDNAYYWWWWTLLPALLQYSFYIKLLELLCTFIQMRLGIAPFFSENVHDEKLAYNSLGRRLEVTSTLTARLYCGEK